MASDAGSAAEGTGASPSAAGSEAVLSVQKGSVEASEASTPYSSTIFLPVALRNSYWQAPESSFGLQMYADRREHTTLLRAGEAGASWVRIPLFWGEIEPENTTPEHYQWPGYYDQWLAQLAGQDFRLILTVTGNPPWAATYLAGPIDKVELAEFVEFMQAAVAHYGAPPFNVRYWELYNEPDSSDSGCAPGGCAMWGEEPAAYAEMLAAIYEPVKTVDPEAQVVLGGLAYDWFTSEGGPFVESFLDGVLENGGGDYFDLMNFHYFPAFAFKWDPYGPEIIGKVNYLRARLAQYGVFKPFICTETGMWSDAPHGSTDELQSRYVPKVFARSMAADLEITIWYKLVDDGYLGPAMWGLVNSELSPKPAHSAYQTLIRQIATAEYSRTLGPGELGTDEIEAYEFAAKDGSATIVIAWAHGESIQALVLQGDSVVVVDKFGIQTQIRDGDDGVVDGQLHLSIGPSPVYLRLAPDSLN